jgi:segregation and condensation protein A
MEEVQQLSFDFDSVQPHIISSARADEAVSLQLGEFAGPLDLLLYLIKQEQANIFDIPIARITDEYLKYIRLMKNFDIAVAGDFLVMATTLIEIKSKMLLPRDPLAEEAEEEMEDPREALVRQLLEHQKFKSAAQMLWTKSTVEQSIFPRGKIETDENNSETNATVFDLLNVFQKILSRHKEEVQMEIAREEMSLADMLRTMRQQISKSKTLNLNEYFTGLHSKRELVLAFLAVLELVKESAINLVQEKVFGEIWAKAN